MMTARGRAGRSTTPTQQRRRQAHRCRNHGASSAHQVIFEPAARSAIVIYETQLAPFDGKSGPRRRTTIDGRANYDQLRGAGELGKGSARHNVVFFSERERARRRGGRKRREWMGRRSTFALTRSLNEPTASIGSSSSTPLEGASFSRRVFPGFSLACFFRGGALPL